MLVSRCVEDDMGLMRGEDLRYAIGVGDIGNQRFKRRQGLHRRKFLLEEKHCVFALIDQQQFLRTESQHLAADFGADRAASPRHEHSAALHEHADGVGVEMHGFAAEQVFDFYRAELNVRATFRPPKHFVDGGNHLYRCAGFGALVEKFPKDFAGDVARLHNHIIHPASGHFASRLSDAAKHRKASKSAVL